MRQFGKGKTDCRLCNVCWRGSRKNSSLSPSSHKKMGKGFIWSPLNRRFLIFLTLSPRGKFPHHYADLPLTHKCKLWNRKFCYLMNTLQDTLKRLTIELRRWWWALRRRWSKRPRRKKTSASKQFMQIGFFRIVLLYGCDSTLILCRVAFIVTFYCSWRVILQRILVNLLVVALLAASGYTVVALVNK